MSTDYTLPPVPKSYIHMGLHVWNERNLRDYGHACAEHARAPLLARIAELERVLSHTIQKPFGPEVCPFTGRDFWGNIEHPELGMVATYGGPFDTYTLPERDSEDQSFHFYRYDHDAGSWTEGVHSLGAVLVDDQLYTSEEDPSEMAADRDRRRAEVEALRAASVIEWEPGRSYTAAELLRQVISNARPRKGDMLWPSVMKLCGVGSTVANHLCRWAGRDPDTGKDIAARKGEGVEGA